MGLTTNQKGKRFAVACCLASYADIRWARHAIFLPHERGGGRLRDEPKECLRRRLLVARKYYDLLRDHRVKHLTRSLVRRKVYFKRDGTSWYVVEQCRNNHTKERNRASREK